MKRSNIIDERTIAAYVAVYGTEMLNFDKFMKKYKENEDKRQD